MGGFEARYANIPRRARLARNAVVAAASEWFAPPALHDIEFAVGEVLAHSALHGYRTGPIMNVWTTRCGNTFVVEVSDSVGVLAPHDLLSIEPEAAAAFGCSIRIVHECMDDVEYTDFGRCVRMTKQIP